MKDRILIECVHVKLVELKHLFTFSQIFRIKGDQNWTASKEMTTFFHMLTKI